MFSTVPPKRVSRPMHVARYWRSRRTTAVILWRSLLECLLVLALLFGATTFVRWVIGPSPISSAIPTVRVRLLIIGEAVGVLLFGLILSPAGRASGSHINPATSLTMWVSGAFRGAAVIPYIVAQLAGSLLGVLTARAVCGSVIDGPWYQAWSGSSSAWPLPCSGRSQEVSQPCSPVRSGNFLRAIMISYGSTCLLRWSELRWRPCCSSS
jgi:glycerol uptake facilitator-like aquaporin